MKSKSKYLQEIDDVIAKGPYNTTLTSLEKFKCPQWYKDGKFGIFIHWGVYSVPAFGSEWYSRNMYKQGTLEYQHHIKTYGEHSQFGYKDFIPMFKAEKFDATKWAKLFKKAGAKYIMPVAEHHDGFAMYDSSFNNWNAAKMGPKRDVINELSNAFRQEGLTLTLSSHRAEHYWFFDGGMDFESDVKSGEYNSLYGVNDCLPVPFNNFTHSYKFHHICPSEDIQNDWLINTCDFVDKYKPQLIYFDWWINNIAYQKVLRKFVAFYYNRCEEWGIEGAINYKFQALTPEIAVFDIERGKLQEIYPQFWQTDTSVSKNSWCYIENNDYKQAYEIIADLIDIVSKNGALLLNIGPKSDGSIGDKDQEILLEIGEWLDINGEAIYNTRPYLIFGEGPTKISSGTFTDTDRDAFTSEDIRFTRNEDTVYAFGLARGNDGVFKSMKLAKFSNSAPLDIKSVKLLGGEKLDFEWDEDSLRVSLGKNKRSNTPYTLKIDAVF